jgi:hypothetical protein
MECKDLRGTMLDAAVGLRPHTSDLERHLLTCPVCFDQFNGLCRTIDLLDEWTVPEPSPQFDAFLRDRLIETKSVTTTRWWFRLRPPVVAVSLAALLLVGAITLHQTKRSLVNPSAVQEFGAGTSPGSAVGDLQSLEEAEELFADFDLLDQLAPDHQNATGLE